MDKPPPPRRKMHTYTVGALLALFVVAVVAALASRLLPGGLAKSAVGPALPCGLPGDRQAALAQSVERRSRKA